MKKDRINQTIMQWLLPMGVLLFLFIILVVRFWVTSRQDEREEVEAKLIAELQTCAGKIDQVLSEALLGTDTVAAYVGNLPDQEADVEAALGGLRTASGAYETVLCTTDGTGFCHNGDTVDLSGTEYIGDIYAGKSRIVYVENDGIKGTSAFVVASPVVRDASVPAYILCYFDKSILNRQLQNIYLDTKTFYVLMENGGQVVLTSGDTDSALCAETDNYFSFLKQAGDNQNASDKIYSRVYAGSSGISYCSSGNETRGLVCVPLKMGNYYLIAGISESYISANIRKECRLYSSMIWQLSAIMLIFIVVLAVVNIIVKVKETEKSKELANKADTDLLTDLYNKTATERKIKEHLANYPDQLGLMFVLDIDNFKKINDTLGHAFGDEVLRTLGARIRSEFRATDIIGRTGGDEFTIFLCNMKEDAIIRAEASRLERFFKDFQAGEYVKYSATASIGAAVYPRDATDFEGLYKAADQALYVAKRRGKKQLAFYGDDK